MNGIDLFAGAGGSTTGAKQAGVNIIWAANHWPEAVNVHQVNHPEVEHTCQDLHQANWENVPAHDVLIASPCCQGHSRARGKNRPAHDSSRSTAWAVVSALEYHRPEAGVVENVREFLRWDLYPAWKMALESLGYSVSPHFLDAADCGIPQNRVRVFIVLTRSKNPILLTFPKGKHIPASTFVDFDAGKWSPIERPGRAQRTLNQIATGRKRFGDRFLIPYYGSGSGKTGRSIDRPIGTIKTVATWGMVKGDQMRMLTVEECSAAMGFPDGYRLTGKRDQDMKLIGNAVPPKMMATVLNKLQEVA